MHQNVCKRHDLCGGGFGEAMPPRDLYFLVLFAGFASKEHQKRMILGGLAAPGTLWVNLPAWAPRNFYKRCR
jgi:hypothetical protein